MIKPSIPKGTRDFGPDVVRKRNYILNTIRGIFETYGFQPLETPAMENRSTLTGKYGEEGDKLMFRILNNGDIYPKAAAATDTPSLAAAVSEKALRYDLTIPFARYMVLHRNDITLPFKRYQIQPVWRADRPQKGRYREFLQCDADIVGSASLLNEMELLALYDTVLHRLGLEGYALLVNNRKLLTGLAELIGKPDQLTAITTAIDKLDKIGIAGVTAELESRGLPAEDIRTINRYLEVSGNNTDKLQQLHELLGGSAIAREGLAELETVLRSAYHSFHEAPVLSPTLARGLNYYTGTILEVKAPPAVRMGSLGGGGRYDNLTGLFGMDGVPAVGISFGVDRIYDVLEELQLFPPATEQSTELLFLQLIPESLPVVFSLLQQLRAGGHAAELYPDAVKLDKQMKYANKRQIPFVVILGESEWQAGTLSVKNMATGEQKEIARDALLGYVEASTR